MLQSITERLRQKHRTVAYPAKEPQLPPRFLGRPELMLPDAATGGAERMLLAAEHCPTGAYSLANGMPALDMGRCTFCGLCAKACPDGVRFTGDYRLGAMRREDLIVRPAAAAARVETYDPELDSDNDADAQALALTQATAALFKRSFRIRQVSAAGCNACEADCNVLGTIVFDLARFGIDYVASPRHADAVLITGPVPRNMQRALRKCYAAVPTPKLVLAVGACAISGGLFAELDQNACGADPILPVSYYIPGCPPHPYTILHGLLNLLGRV